MQTFIYTIFIILIIGMIILIGATIFFFFYEAKIEERDAYNDVEDEPEKNYELVGQVIGTYGVCEGMRVSLRAGNVCTLGKADNCDFQVRSNVVSRMHCTIKLLENGTFEITDFSTNGTYYNNYRLEKNSPFQVPGDALLAVGDANNIIRVISKEREM